MATEFDKKMFLNEVANRQHAEYYYNEAFSHSLKSSSPDGEVYIAMFVESAYKYALNVLKRPFHAGERIIATDAGYSYHYAHFVLKEHFPLGEAIIATDAYYSYSYAVFLNERFLLGEPVIEASCYWEDYCLFFDILPKKKDWSFGF